MKMLQSILVTQIMFDIYMLREGYEWKIRYNLDLIEDHDIV